MIFESFSLLEKAHQFSLQSPIPLPELSSTLFTILSNFRTNAETRFNQIQPKDSESFEIKQFFFSEFETWTYLLSLSLSQSSFKAFFEPKKAIKFAFFRNFNAKISEVFLRKDLRALEEMKSNSCYLNNYYISDLGLVNDILNYDETLWTLHSLVQQFSSQKPFLYRKNPEISSENFKKIASLAEWDFLGSEDAEISEIQQELLQNIYVLIRNGGLVEAQKLLCEKNRYVFAALLNSGLAYHDFTRLDAEFEEFEENSQGINEGNSQGIYEGNYDENYEGNSQNSQRVRGILVEENSRNFEGFDWEYSEKYKEKSLKTMDFMDCMDFRSVCEDRKKFYLEKVLYLLYCL